MKKTLLLILSAFCSLLAGAQAMKTYTENLVVSINGESTEPQKTMVTVVENTDGTIDFRLENFSLVSGEATMPVGNIVLTGLPVDSLTGDCKTFAFNDSIVIAEGSDSTVEMWLGPMLGDVPLVMRGKMTDSRLYVSIDIDMMATLGQIIKVTLGINDFPASAYTENLVVTINDESTEPAPTTVQVVQNAGGTIDFRLENFSLVSGEATMPVGNIVLSDLPVAWDKDGIREFAFNDSIVITEGSDSTVEMWLGPMLGSVPLAMKGRMTEDKLYVTIDIDMMATLGQIIKVVLGDNNFPKYYVATFVAEGDTVSTQRLLEGDSIVAPAMAEREGYTFQWQNLPDHITADTVIVGSYVANIYKVYYKVGDEVYKEYGVAYGEALPEAPAYTPQSDEEYIYTFEGWQGDTYTTMPAHDVTYTAIIKATPTGISGIAAGEVKGDVRDLQGRRVQRMTKGIYVVNGRKVMVK